MGESNPPQAPGKAAAPPPDEHTDPDERLGFSEIVEAFRESQHQVRDERERDSFTFEFSADVPSNTPEDNPVTRSRAPEFRGRIRRLIVGWPPNTGNGVGVKFGTQSGEIFFPRNEGDDFIAAQDFTHPFVIRVTVTKGTPLRASFVNFDSSDHFVNCMAEIEEVN